MGMLDVGEIERLVESDRVHRAVYTDPALFELEMERLFGRAWLVLGHESQVRAPGEFFTTRMGRESVIVTRHTDGSVRVLVNRCAHRGLRVCEAARGHARQLVCPYHGWTYDTDGTLRSVPFADGYERPVTELPELALARVPRVEAYRGFVFASLAPDGPSLLDFLGPLRASFDDFVDRAPPPTWRWQAGCSSTPTRGTGSSSWRTTTTRSTRRSSTPRRSGRPASSRSRRPTPTRRSRSARCCRTAPRPRCGRRPGSGSRASVTATWGTTTTTAGW